MISNLTKTGAVGISTCLTMLLGCAELENYTEAEINAADSAAATAMVPDSAPSMASGSDEPGGTAELREIEGSGVTGEIAIIDLGQRTQVVVRLTGAPSHASHPGHIHGGTCPAIGVVTQPLRPVVTDSTGTGSATTELEVDASSLTDGRHIVVYHGTGGRPITCAAIPAPRR
jgi:hypothetical protein